MARAGVVYGTPSRDGGLFCDYEGGGGKMVVDGGFFGRMLKNGVKVWNFFCIFCNFA